MKVKLFFVVVCFLSLVAGILSEACRGTINQPVDYSTVYKIFDNNNNIVFEYAGGSSWGADGSTMRISCNDKTVYVELGEGWRMERMK